MEPALLAVTTPEPLIGAIDTLVETKSATIELDGLSGSIQVRSYNPVNDGMLQTLKRLINTNMLESSDQLLEEPYSDSEDNLEAQYEEFDGIVPMAETGFIRCTEVNPRSYNVAFYQGIAMQYPESSDASGVSLATPVDDTIGGVDEVVEDFTPDEDIIQSEIDTSPETLPAPTEHLPTQALAYDYSAIVEPITEVDDTTAPEVIPEPEDTGDSDGVTEPASVTQGADEPEALAETQVSEEEGEYTGVQDDTQEQMVEEAQIDLPVEEAVIDSVASEETQVIDEPLAVELQEAPDDDQPDPLVCINHDPGNELYMRYADLWARVEGNKDELLHWYGLDQQLETIVPVWNGEGVPLGNLLEMIPVGSGVGEQAAEEDFATQLHRWNTFAEVAAKAAEKTSESNEGSDISLDAAVVIQHVITQ